MYIAWKLFCGLVIFGVFCAILAVAAVLATIALMVAVVVLIGALCGGIAGYLTRDDPKGSIES